jgi:hypothetical protein
MLLVKGAALLFFGMDHPFSCRMAARILRGLLALFIAFALLVYAVSTFFPVHADA